VKIIINRYSFISILSHAVLLLAMILTLKLSNETTLIGDEKILDSYIYKNEKHYQVNVNTVKHQAIPKSKNTSAISLKKTEKVEMKKQVTSIQKSTAASSSNGTRANELLTALHTAIQAHQHYPESAMNMERQGRVTTVFMLLPDGTIRNLRLLKSSGTASLDNAALAAVHDAVPFQSVNKYISAEKEFSIDVVFELA